MVYKKLLVGALSTLLLCSLEAGAYKQPKNMVINVPVTHLMSKPNARNKSYEKCSIQATQLIFGEHVTAHEELNGWMRVKAVEQRAQWKHKWINCSGWIPVSHATAVKKFPKENIVVSSHCAPLKLGTGKQIMLSFGTKLVGKKTKKNNWVVALAGNKKALISDAHISTLVAAPKKEIDLVRSELVLRATQFLGDPYLWAGRSAYNPDKNSISGVDCSGLMNLLYRSVGINIPRCSHDQYAQSRKVAQLGHLNVGDMVFVYYPQKNNPTRFSDRIGHVMMYIGNDRLIEAEGEESGHVRVVLGHQRFGKPIESITSGDGVQQFKMLARSPLGNKCVLTESPLGKCKLVFGSYLAS